MAGRSAHGSDAARRIARFRPLVPGYHALLTLDYDLTAEFEPWEPPQPFDENTFAFPNRMFTKAELLGYLDYCRGRVRRTLTRSPRTRRPGRSLRPSIPRHALRSDCRRHPAARR